MARDFKHQYVYIDVNSLGLDSTQKNICMKSLDSLSLDVQLIYCPQKLTWKWVLFWK